MIKIQFTEKFPIITNSVIVSNLKKIEKSYYMTKTKFRSKKLDNKKPLTIHKSSTLADLDELNSLQRNLVQVETGVEKEEEEVRILFMHLLSSYLPYSFIYPTPKRAPKYFDFWGRDYFLFWNFFD